MTQNLSWDLYRTFLAVLTEGSLSGAARALGITQPTAGRHIAALEAALGQTLFTRSQTGLLATDAAQSLRPHAQAMQHTATAFERAAATHGDGVNGVVRISASEVVGVEVLPPILSALRRAYPQLTLELVPTNRIQDLLHREVDIAVRMAPPQQEALIARRVGSVDVGLHARDDYLARYGAPSTLADLVHHTVIGFDRMTPFLRDATRRYPDWARERFAFRADSDLAQLAMLRAGYGIGACQVPLARRDTRLVRLLPGAFRFKLQAWVTMHEDLRSSPRCKATFDALVAGLSAYMAE